MEADTFLAVNTSRNKCQSNAETDVIVLQYTKDPKSYINMIITESQKSINIITLN